MTEMKKAALIWRRTCLTHGMKFSSTEELVPCCRGAIIDTWHPLSEGWPEVLEAIDEMGDDIHPPPDQLEWLRAFESIRENLRALEEKRPGVTGQVENLLRRRRWR